MSSGPGWKQRPKLDCAIDEVLPGSSVTEEDEVPTSSITPAQVVTIALSLVGLTSLLTGFAFAVCWGLALDGARWGRGSLVCIAIGVLLILWAGAVAKGEDKP